MDFAQERGAFEMVKVMSPFSVIPAVISSVEVRVEKATMVVTVRLPAMANPGPLFVYKSLQVNYKKATFLGKNESVVVELAKYFRENEDKEKVVVVLSNLSSDVGYQIKARVANENGWSEWSKSVECKLEESSDEEPGRRPSKNRTPRRQKPSSSESDSESDSESSSGSDSGSESESSSEDSDDHSKKVGKHSLKREEGKRDARKEKVGVSEKPKEEKKPVEKVKEKSVEKVKEGEKEEKVEEKVEKETKPEHAPEKKDTSVASSNLLSLLLANDLTSLQSLPAATFTGYRSAEGLPLLHALILNTTSTHTAKAAITFLLDQGCDLNEDVTTVHPTHPFHP